MLVSSRQGMEAATCGCGTHLKLANQHFGLRFAAGAVVQEHGVQLAEICQARDILG